MSLTTVGTLSGAAKPTTTSALSPSGPSQSARGELSRVLRTFRREFIWVCIFSMFANVLMLTPTLYMLQVFDRVMQSGNELTLLALTGMMVFLYLVMGFAEWVRSRLLVRVSTRIDEALGPQVYGATFRAQLSSTNRNALQPLNDLNQLRQFLTGNGIFAVVDTPWSVVYLFVLFLMHPWLGWLSVLFCIVQCAIAYAAHHFTSQRHHQTQELALDTQAYLQAKLRNAETVEAMGMLGNLRQQWLALYERQLAAHADAQEMGHRIQAVAKFVQYSQQALILSLGAVLALNGKISPGAMVASNALMGNALRPFSVLVQAWKQFIDARDAYRRVDKLLREHPAPAGEHRASDVKGGIGLRALVATAPGRAAPILQGLDLDIPAGEVIAVIGPSGAGKSPLARCLLGIWPDTRGQVLLDGVAIEQWSRQELGANLGYLPQDIELFDGSIAENIARFTGADASLVIDAAQRTGIHDMILRLPSGYDTPMGEAGSLLSGGQRQRVALARAILGNPALVVLDEPSANLDDAGEAALVAVVRDLKKRGKTVVMIVHQQHLLAVADRVLRLDAGRIVQFARVVMQPTPPPTLPPTLPQLAAPAALNSKTA